MLQAAWLVADSVATGVALVDPAVHGPVVRVVTVTKPCVKATRLPLFRLPLAVVAWGSSAFRGARRVPWWKPAFL